jgi:hypothetical protein
MYTVTHIDQNGVTRKLLLTEAEYQTCLHRAQENPEDLDTPIEQVSLKSDGDCVDV